MDITIECSEVTVSKTGRSVLSVSLDEIDKRDLNNGEVAKCIDFDVYCEAKGVDEVIAYLRANYELDQD